MLQKDFAHSLIGYQTVRVFLPLEEIPAIQKKIALLIKKGGAVKQGQKNSPSKKMSQKNVTLMGFYEILVKWAYFIIYYYTVLYNSFV